MHVEPVQPDAAPVLSAPRGAPVTVRFCEECGQPFYPGRRDQNFCRPVCRQAHHRRRYERGAALYDFAMAWRGKRLRGGFTDLCRMLDDWLHDERTRRQRHKALRDAYAKQEKEGGRHGR